MPAARGVKTDFMARKKSNPNTALFKRLGLRETNPGVFCGQWSGGGKTIPSVSPIDGKVLAKVRQASAAEYEQATLAANKAFKSWRNLPAPKRGEIIRKLGNALRAAKSDLGRLVSLETGKILAEGEETAIRELYGWAQKGPSAARVDRVDTRWRSYTGDFADFRIVD